MGKLGKGVFSKGVWSSRVKNIEWFNEELLRKWRWALFPEEQSSWVTIINSKYSGWRGLVDTHSQNTSSIWWRDLSRVCGINSVTKWFDSSFEWRVGRGNLARFLKDDSLGHGPHETIASRLFSIAWLKEAYGSLG